MNTQYNSLIKQVLKLFPSFFLVLFMTLNLSASAEGEAAAAGLDGATIFKKNCAVCHRMDGKKLTGPALNGVFDRVPGEEWTFNWIKNSAAMLKAGDAYGQKIYDEYGTAMNVFDGVLSDDEIHAVIAYLKNPPVIEEKTTEVVNGGGEVATEEGLDPLWVVVVIIVFLFFMIGILRGTKNSLSNIIRNKAGEEELPRQTFWEEARDWANLNKRLVAVLILLTLGWVSKEGWYALKDIGVYEGYKPEQPIQFSHKIHAGDNGIECVYCHSGAERGRTAGIPSANVCMNCHKGISEGPTTGETEIAKIYEAVGWDPATQQYSKPQKPIKWVKVHNLPDFVYFNHSQHVVVGKQECETCHGDVKGSMDVVEQHSPLTMGWCVDCHKETQVAMKDNPYYEDLHAKLAAKFGKDEPITVDKMGGIECGKCHY